MKKASKMARNKRNSVDVGCMQLNTRYHKKAFASYKDMLDPIKNITYAAQLLKKHYKKRKSWRYAVGRYHSGTYKYHERYVHRVYKVWRTILLP